MNSPPGQQLTTELQDATPQDTASKPRVSIGKLQKPTARSERVVRSMKPRKLGVTNNLRRLEGGPSRDVFDPLSSPEKEKCRPRPRQLEVWDRTISPRRNEARRVNQPVRRERYAMLDAAPVLKATDQGSAHDSPRKHTSGMIAAEFDQPEEKESPAFLSPVAVGLSQTLANAVEDNADVQDGRHVPDAIPTQDSAQDNNAAQPVENIVTCKGTTRSSRRSKPVGLSAREPAPCRADRRSPQVVVMVPKRIRPQSIFPMDEDVSVDAAIYETGRRQIQQPALKQLRQKRNETPPISEYQGDDDQGDDDQGDDDQSDDDQSDDDQSDDDQSDVDQSDHDHLGEVQATQSMHSRTRPVHEHPKKRKAEPVSVVVRPSKMARKGPRTPNLGLNHELFGQQPLLRQAYLTVERIGWTIKNGEPYDQSDVDLDDGQVKSLIKLCRKAKTKLSDPTADPSEELIWICNGIRNLKERDEYFDDQNKVNNIFFHLFGTLVKLVRHAIDCYGEMDRNDADLTPYRSITITHLNIVATLISHITSLYETLEKKYCAPRPGLCVKQPVHKIIILLRPVQDRFLREIRLYHENQKREMELQARAEAAALLSKHHEQESALAAHHASIREKWLRLHEERRHVDYNILPVWKQHHLRVPSLEHTDRDSNGEEFQRVEVFTPRLGPSLQDTEKARQVEWSAYELDALRTGLRELAGPRVFVKIFRRYCGRGGPLNRFNVTEIVTTAADMRQWEEERQRRRRGGSVEEWVETLKGEMWTKSKMSGYGQENGVSE